MNDEGYVKIRNFFYREDENSTLVLFNHVNKISLSGETSKDVCKILPLLDGNYTIKEICNRVEMPIEYVLKIMKVLEENNIISIFKNSNEFGKTLNHEVSIFENLSLRKMSTVDHYISDRKRILSKNIQVVGENYIAKQININLSNHFNIVNDRNNYNPDFIIAVDYYENIDLISEIEMKAQKDKIPFMRVIVNNTNLYLGPIFIPFEGPCYKCFLSRLYSNYGNLYYMKNFSELHQKITDKHLASIPGVTEIAIGYIKTQIFKYFSRNLQSDLVGHEYSYNLESLDSNLSPVFKVPGCKHCIRSSEVG
ncbi:TOMM precursor leader peptide-binding protein [Fredinandcohnia humi]